MNININASKPLFLQVAIATPLRRTFDYLPSENTPYHQLQPGVRVTVPFGKRVVIGVIIAQSHVSRVAESLLKPIVSLLDEIPLLMDEDIALAQWVSSYYHHPIGEVLFHWLPTKLRKKSKECFSHPSFCTSLLVGEGGAKRRMRGELILNTEQQHAVDAICSAQNTFQVFTLEGVTGSGKTEVYLQSVEQYLNAGKQVLVLVPEIGLTPQIIERFEQRFQIPVAAIHSGLTERQRFDSWLAARTCTAAIVIGTRSAIFTPMPNLGLIILDEEHDASFKQQEGLRYSARDVAIVRAQQLKIPVVLGSATLSLETILNAQQKRYQHLILSQRATAAPLPKCRAIDVRGEYCEEGLSHQLMTCIENHLEQRGQILLFLNRRGFAPSLICHPCGWVAQCTRCDTHLTLHHASLQLRCHHCDAVSTLPTSCPKCRHHQLVPVGLGTERIEQALQKHFGGAGIVRIDSDNTRKAKALETLFADIHAKKYQILIGTQMLAKGHHFPDVTLAAIIDGDVGFFSADFRACEHLGQLITQVGGRAGRAEKIGEVVIQTRHPNHPLLQCLLSEGYTEFSRLLLQERLETNYPPHGYLALLRATATQKQAGLNFLQEVKHRAQKFLQQQALKNIKIYGPVPAPMEKCANLFRVQLLLHASQRSALHQLLAPLMTELESMKSARRVRWSLDVDPQVLF